MNKYKELNYHQAISCMIELKKETNDVGIFTDRGWGDDPEVETSYDIIIDGNGQKPVAWITKETFNLLLKNKIIGPNTLLTYKARTFHDFIHRDDKND